ncbi:MAG TPA: hypothetical protein VHV82_11350 [Sporichthyaceae bacterium]|nr:hypothetical protein [Sporichthyaceae bacterium]
MEVTIVPSEVVVRRGDLVILAVEVTDGGSAHECKWKTDFPGMQQPVTHGPEWRLSAPAVLRTHKFEVFVDVTDVDSGTVASAVANVTLNP